MKEDFSNYPTGRCQQDTSIIRSIHKNDDYDLNNEWKKEKTGFNTIVNGLYVSAFDLKLTPSQKLVIPNVTAEQYCSLAFILPGSTTESIKISHTIKEGFYVLPSHSNHVCLLPRGYNINITGDKDKSIKLLLIILSFEWLNACLDNMKLRNEKVLRYILTKNKKIMYWKMNDTTLELAEYLADLNWSIPFVRVLARAKIFETFYHLLETLSMRKSQKKKQINKCDLEKMYEVKAILMQNRLQCPSIKEMSGLMHMSESKFKKLFKAVFEQPYYAYFLQIKLAHCMKLLKSGEFSVTELAYMAGYNSPSKFTEIFRRKYKVTPRHILKGKTPSLPRSRLII